MNRSTTEKPDASREVERLRNLAQYQIMDTPPEEQYDDLTALASQVCSTPISVISLLDRSRQWFKSVVGLDVSETPRDWAFCHYAIQQDDVMIVPDALEDERFKTNPLVLEQPHIRFYAGVPLVTPEGHRLGTLCVIDTEPRQLLGEQQEVLKVLARQAMNHLNSHRRHVHALRSMDTQSQQIEKLEAALEQMKWLDGLITICSGCKQIRDDNGFWQKLENYIQHNSGAEFSHGICPSCREELYPKPSKADSD